ncbi:MAG TPA: flagellar basal-body rod protein FlgF [Rhodospirillaceae bacterium]|nr:flagellar basal-body rod protein FlgF [Rhodospirillaceae bacterium]
MENTTYISLSSQTALWRDMEVVANNMANANTPAYKTEEPMFREFMVKAKSDASPFGRKLSFVHDAGLLRDTREGPLTDTGNSFDLAISGDGYFTLDTPAGPRYTREGHFRLDETGMLVSASGYPVMQQNDQPIIIAPNETQVNIASDGSISTENGNIGKVKLVKFDNEQELHKAGNGTYQTSADANPVEKPNIVQGMLEQSNVQPIVQMTKMMQILRTYEGVQNMLMNEHDRQLKAMPILSQSQQA